MYAAGEDGEVQLEALVVEREKLVLEKQVGNTQEIVPNKIKQAVCKAVCKIQLPEESWATGFFVILKIGNQEYYGLCTNNHVIDFQYVRSGSDVTCISDEEQVVHLSISNYSFTSKLLDTTFIEVSVSQRSEITSKGFSLLHTDEEVQVGQTILVGQHPRGEGLAIETGSILEFTDDALGFYHSANTDYGSSGGPVTNNQGRVIGIHRGGHWKKSIARNIGVLLDRMCGEIAKDAARTPPVKEVKVVKNSVMFLPSVKMRPIAQVGVQPADSTPTGGQPQSTITVVTQPSQTAHATAGAAPDNLPIFLLPYVSRGEQTERPARPAKSAPPFKQSGSEAVTYNKNAETAESPSSKTVRFVCNSICSVKLPNGSSGCGFLFGVNVDNVMHHGLITTSKIVHSTYIQTYSALRCKFGLKVVYVKLSSESFKFNVRGALFVEISSEDRDKIAKDITVLQAKPQFSVDEPYFAAQRDEPSALVLLTGVTDLDESHFSYFTSIPVLPGTPIVNAAGNLVGVSKQRRREGENEYEYIAIKLTDIVDTIVDERRRFYSKLQRRKKKDAQQQPQQLPETHGARCRALLRATISDSFQNVEDVLTRTVCKVEAKSGTALGFFGSFFGGGGWHFGLFTSERVIHSRYLQNNSYVRCMIGDEDVCIPTGYAFCCPLFGVTFLDMSHSYKKNKKRDSPLKRVPFLTVSLKDYESIVILQRLNQKETPPLVETTVGEFRGVHFGYTSSHKCRLAGAPICDPFGFVLALQTCRSTKSGLLLGAQMRYVCDAILRDKAQSAGNFPRVLQPLKPWRLDKLQEHSFEKCNETVFLLRSSNDLEPAAWFRRTIHGWFWSPLDPLNRKTKDDAFWIRITKLEGFTIVGGKRYGKEAPAEVKVAISFLREHGDYYL